MSNFAKQINKLKSLLPQVMAAERMAAVREIERLTRKKTGPLAPGKLRLRIERLEKRLRASERKRSWRQKNLPQFDDNVDLPISASKTEIIRAIKRHPVVIVSGETGSGKTTQLPKF